MTSSDSGVVSRQSGGLGDDPPLLATGGVSPCQQGRPPPDQAEVALQPLLLVVQQGLIGLT